MDWRGEDKLQDPASARFDALTAVRRLLKMDDSGLTRQPGDDWHRWVEAAAEITQGERLADT
jgi:hypothetical protein